MQTTHFASELLVVKTNVILHVQFDPEAIRTDGALVAEVIAVAHWNRDALPRGRHLPVDATLVHTDVTESARETMRRQS